MGNFPGYRNVFNIPDIYIFSSNPCEVAVIQINHPLSVRGNRGNITGDQRFAIADADDNRTAVPGDDNGAGICYGYNRNPVSTVNFFQRCGSGAEQIPFVAFGNQVGQNLAVGFRDKDTPFALQMTFQFQIILNNAVMDNRETS